MNVKLGLALATIALTLSSCVTVEGPAPAGPRELLIAGARIIDGTGAPAFYGSVLIRGHRIAAVTRGPLPHGTSVTQTIDASGRTVVPGLWDSHVHLAEARLYPGWLRDFIAHGVTSVRDAGGHIAVLNEWGTAVAAGHRLGPDIYSAGPTLNGPGDDSYHVEVTDEEEAKDAVEIVVASGAVAVTVHQRLRPAVFRAVIDAATANGTSVFGHVPIGIDPVTACRWGLAGFEHLGAVMAAYEQSDASAGLSDAARYLTSASSRPWYDCLVDRGAYVDPTLVSHRYLGRAGDAAQRSLAERQITAMLPIVKRLQHRGVPLLAGSDVGPAVRMPAGRSLLEELQLLRRAGLSWPQVIRAASGAPAAVVGVADWVGVVAPGKAADLVIFCDEAFDGSPGIAAGPDIVIKRGRVVVKNRSLVELDRAIALR